MKHTRLSLPTARTSLATCAILLGAATALAQSTSSSSSSSSTPSTSSAGSNYGSTDKNLNGSSSANAGTNATTGGSAYGSTSASGQPAASGTKTDANSTAAGAMTGRETTTATTAKLGFTDRRFVSKAAEDGKAEVQLAELAAQRATNTEVRSFAEKLVSDHKMVNDELTSIASAKSVKLDTDDDHDRAYKRLAKKSGADFDQEFVEHMIDEHEKDIKMFEKASKDAKDAEVRSFAAKHVDHLRQHLQTAQGLRSSIVPTGRASSMSGHPDSSSTSATPANDATSTTTAPKTSTDSGSDTPRRQ